MINVNVFGMHFYQVFKNISKIFHCKKKTQLKKKIFRFSSILTARGKLIDENNALAKQNDELRLLLSKYMQSKVNQELQIPPSQIIQLQLAEQSSGSGGY